MIKHTERKKARKDCKEQIKFALITLAVAGGPLAYKDTQCTKQTVKKMAPDGGSLIFVR